MDKIFKALADKNRRRILTILNEHNGMSVGELHKNFDINQGTLSNHLAILKKARLVQCRVDGKLRYYRLVSGCFEAFVNQLNKFVGLKVREENVVEEIKVRRSKLVDI